jgi:hypothetical protein
VPVSSEDLSQLYNLASQQQFELNSPNTYGTIPSISGATLASAVLQQLQHAVASGGVSDKLTLLFGSFEPFLAFFSLSNLATGPSAEMVRIIRFLPITYQFRVRKMMLSESFHAQL